MTEEGKKFQSTPPCGGDMAATKAMLVMVYFNPRPLAGATQCSDATEIFILFQSTPPCGGDGNTELALRHSLISIHAPLRGRRGFLRLSGGFLGFQSTPPCGGDGRCYRRRRF